MQDCTVGIQERRDSGLEGYRERHKRRVQDRRDEGQVGCRLQNRWDAGWRKSGLEGYMKRRKRRVQNRRDAEQEICWTGGIKDRWNGS